MGLGGYLGWKDVSLVERGERQKADKTRNKFYLLQSVAREASRMTEL